MSLVQQLLRDYRPLMRMLDVDPKSYQPPYGSICDERFLHSAESIRPVVDVTEEGDGYIIEVELPAVKKEHLTIKVGNGGRSVTIEAKVIRRPRRRSMKDDKSSTDSSTERRGRSLAGSNYTASESNPTFARTIWLPLRVDGSKICATLGDGLLTLGIPKLNDAPRVSILSSD